MVAGKGAVSGEGFTGWAGSFGVGIGAQVGGYATDTTTIYSQHILDSIEGNIIYNIWYNMEVARMRGMLS